MKKRHIVTIILIFVVCVGMFSVDSFASSGKNLKKNEIIYSNLVDKKTRKDVKKSLIAAGLNRKNVNQFTYAVRYYNKSVGDVGMVKKGFKKSKSLEPVYDYEKIAQNWEKANPSLNAYYGNRNNCRMTAFVLANNLINVKGNYVKKNEMLFVDNDTIKNSSNKFFSKKNVGRFNTFYGDIKTKMIKDPDFHLKKVKKYWKTKKVSFKKSRASVVTVWFHDDVNNSLFVGHAGILVPNKNGNGFLFVEKVSFEDPYQVLKVRNRKELKNYLMGKYDTAYGQPTAKPFAMENGNLL